MEGFNSFYSKVLGKEGDKVRVLWANTEFGNIISLETPESAAEVWKYFFLKELDNSIKNK